jgi:hypothetical protein
VVYRLLCFVFFAKYRGLPELALWLTYFLMKEGERMTVDNEFNYLTYFMEHCP